MDRKDGVAVLEVRTNNAGIGEQFSVPMVVATIPQLIVERISEHAVLPKYAKDGDSGMDVYSTVDVLLRPQEKTLIPLGLKFDIPKHPLHELGYRWGMTLRPRSGLTSKTEIEAYIGTVDNTYRDEVKVIVKNVAQQRYFVEYDRDDNDVPHNFSLEMENDSAVCDLAGNRVEGHELNTLRLLEWYGSSLPKGALLIRKGDRIAQLVFEQVVRPMEIVEGTVSMEGSRGGGFGHTGVSFNG